MAAVCDKYKIKYILPGEADGVDQLKRLVGTPKPA